MTSFLLLYNGPPTPPGVTHEGWPEWLAGIGDALVDIGSPMRNGIVLHADGSTSETATSLNGFGIVQAEDRGQALELLRDHPFLAHGHIEVFEVPRVNKRRTA
jgi:hypothetical protein